MFRAPVQNQDNELFCKLNQYHEISGHWTNKLEIMYLRLNELLAVNQSDSPKGWSQFLNCTHGKSQTVVNIQEASEGERYLLVMSLQQYFGHLEILRWKMIIFYAMTKESLVKPEIVPRNFFGTPQELFPQELFRSAKFLPLTLRAYRKYLWESSIQFVSAVQPEIRK